ncbi:MAG: hypothetical protein KF760_27405 [Candidatus Eremiobacteraeota bacterium]|nr:hypothetical protein [Candidatus Eremiobacteraeota bacterium]MCW5869891.1 hypothetical protein [Candidatus Eremiobacteraeota bacterium]
MARLRLLFGLFILLLGLGWSARIPWGESPAHATLRLSWRCNGQEIKVPIAQDPNLPAHMRLPPDQAYQVRMRSYLLRVLLDGRPLLEKRIEPAGVRHDRPLSVLEELAVAPGRHRVEVEFRPEPLEGVKENLLPGYQGQLDFGAGRVQLITFQEEGHWQLKP